MPIRLPALALVLGLAACQPASQGAAGSVSATPAPVAASEDRGGIAASISDIAFAEAACAGCHAIRPLELSPNPEAPSFSDIANREGLTAGTLSAFLRDAHNYPEAMDFDLTPARVEALTRHILMLKDESYEPPA